MKRRRLWLSSVGLCTNVASNVANGPRAGALAGCGAEPREAILGRV